MANTSPGQHQNPAIGQFWRIWLGRSAASQKDAGNKLPAEYHYIQTSEVKWDALEGGTAKFHVADRSHNGYQFATRIKTLDSKVTITLPASKDTDWLRAAWYNFFDARTDMRRWEATFILYDEQDKQKIVGYKGMNGILTKQPAREGKADGENVVMEEFEFTFERIQDLNVLLDQGSEGVYSDITDNPSGFDGAYYNDMAPGSYKAITHDWK